MAFSSAQDIHVTMTTAAATSATPAEIEVRDVPDISPPLHASAVAHRVLAARGVTDVNELDFSLAHLPKPDKLPGIDKAVARLQLARARQERITVVGDYDCDGATSTAVAVLGLAMMGFEQVDYLVPNRFEYGYGLSPAIVDVAKRGDPSLILTVDNGVASVDGVERANELGIDVVVTDHHLPPAQLPQAVAIVNPTLPNATFPSRNLAGVGVLFYVLLALRRALAEEDDVAGAAPLADLLDLVAIGTVADLVPLDRVNRTLVEQGLRRIRAGRSRPGVLALIKVAGRDHESLSTTDIGFGIAPRLNAAGRLDDIAWGIRCLLSEDALDAHELATALDTFNKERRQIEAGMRESASAQLARIDTDSSDDRFGICLMDETWHQGVIGIVAGRLKERLHRPVVVFTADSEDTLKGSARSIPGVHVRDVLQAIVARHPGMIDKFGGHAMAAGLSLPREQFESFEEAFDEEVRRVLNDQRPTRTWVTDGSLDTEELDLDTALLLSSLMPWGQGFAAPIFTNEFLVKTAKPVGKGHLKLSVVTDHGSLDAIAFNCTLPVQHGDWVRLVYSLDVNRWRNRVTLQLNVLHLEPVRFG